MNKKDIDELLEEMENCSDMPSAIWIVDEKPEEVEKRIRAGDMPEVTIEKDV